MRVPGFCTGCRKIKQVTAKTLGAGGAIGMCASCEERESRPDVVLTVYVTTGATPESIPPASAVVGRPRGDLIEVAYESCPNPPSNLAALEERLGRAADRLLRGSPGGRAHVEAHRLHAVGTFDTRLRRMTAVHDRRALGRWLATGGRG